MWENVGFKVLNLVRGLDKDVMANELIDQDLCLWKKDLLSVCFDPLEAK